MIPSTKRLIFGVSLIMFFGILALLFSIAYAEESDITRKSNTFGVFEEKPEIIYPYIPTLNYTVPEYSLEFITDEKDWEKEIIITGVSITIDDIESIQCVPYYKYSSGCPLIMVLQNEKIIEQNDIIIGLLEEIRDQ